MDVSEISLKLAQLSLQTKQTEIWSDLIKIGIPSFVALAGAYCAYHTGIKSNQKDLIIAKLGSKSKQLEDRSKLINISIVEISISITSFHISVTEFISLFVSSMSGNFSDQDKIATLIKKQYSVVDKISCLYEVESKILLLGNTDVVTKFDDFKNNLLNIFRELKIGDKFDQETLAQRGQIIRNKKDVLYKALSDIYLKSDDIKMEDLLT